MKSGGDPDKGVKAPARKLAEKGTRDDPELT